MKISSEKLINNLVINDNIFTSFIYLKPQDMICWVKANSPVNIVRIKGGRSNILNVSDSFIRTQLSGSNKVYAVPKNTVFAIENMEFDQDLELCIAGLYKSDLFDDLTEQDILEIKKKYPNQSGIISMFTI